ncbi:helix-turn-helix domain-containing protein [Micromonospora carbonacea]|uniref:helix-turn-helix domain-containing protein n=1 Tax=Micromonospora carbonacea TaxID=47853 RepID=UPI003719EAF4
MTNPLPRDPKIPDLVSLQEAAEILGISKQAVHKRVEAAQLVGARVGTAWVFRRAVVEAARPAPATD